MELLFTFSDNTTITSEFVLQGAKLTECLHSNLLSVDNSLTVKVPFNEDLCDMLKSDINNDVKVQLIENNANLYTGYVRKNLSFIKMQRNQPFSLEVIPPSFLINQTYSGSPLNITSPLVSNVIINLIGQTSFSGSIDVTQMGSEQMEIFTLEDGDNILSVLKELCFEYGYVFNFDADGNVVILPLFSTVPDTITQHFDGTNCLNQIEQKVVEDSFSQVAVNWNKVEQIDDVLIFEDTTGADDNNPANIVIGANSYYLGEETNYLEYDSKYQAINWISAATPTIEYTDATVINATFSNLGKRASLSVYNNSDVSNTITKLVIRGSGYFETSTNTNKAGNDAGETKEIDAKYIQANSYAILLAKALKDYYIYANFSVVVQSKDVFEIGTYCDVSDNGIGTVTCRVIKRAWNIYSNTYEYTLESISDYDPVETVTSTSTTRSRGDNGETLRDTVDGLSSRVDAIVVDAATCFLDSTQSFIALDDSGKTVIGQDFSTTITLRQGSEELDFIVGAISLPDGWSYTVNGKTVTFHVDEGVSVQSGKILIPVQYRPILYAEDYVDENGELYEDEDNVVYQERVYSTSYTQWNLYYNYYGNDGGIYLGLITSINDIPDDLNIGDYFTWGAEDYTTSLSNEGEFKTARIYTYIGEDNTWKFNADLSIERCNVAMSDILGIANADLENNNSTVYEYLDHLTANSIYADLIIANEVFIDTLIADEGFISSLSASLITSGEVTNAALEEVLSTTGIDTLTDYTIISNGYIKSGLIDVDAIRATEGFFEDITVTGVISGATGILNNVQITGSSTFEGDIFSGPLELSSASPEPTTLTFAAGSSFTSTQVNQVRAYSGLGTYGGYTFTTLELTYSETVWTYYTTLTLYNGSSVVFQNTQEHERYYVLDYEMTYTYEISSDTKTFKLIDLPTTRPSESGVVWNDNGTLKIVS